VASLGSVVGRQDFGFPVLVHVIVLAGVKNSGMALVAIVVQWVVNLGKIGKKTRRQNRIL